MASHPSCQCSLMLSYNICQHMAIVQKPREVLYICYFLEGFPAISISTYVLFIFHRKIGLTQTSQFILPLHHKYYPAICPVSLIFMLILVFEGVNAHVNIKHKVPELLSKSNTNFPHKYKINYCINIR